MYALVVGLGQRDGEWVRLANIIAANEPFWNSFETFFVIDPSTYYSLFGFSFQGKFAQALTEWDRNIKTSEMASEENVRLCFYSSVTRSQCDEKRQT